MKNVRIDGTAKIGDFGLAVAIDRSRLTTEGMMVGTLTLTLLWVLGFPWIIGQLVGLSYFDDTASFGTKRPEVRILSPRPLK